MKRLMTCAILSAFSASAANAAVIVFDSGNGFGPMSIEDAAAQAASGKGVATFFGKAPSPSGNGNAPTLANAVGGGSIGMWTKPPQTAVALATEGGGPALVGEGREEGLGVVPLPGALLLLFGALGALALGAGARWRQTVS